MVFHCAGQGVPGYGALSSTRPRGRSIAPDRGGGPRARAPLLLASAADADEAGAALLAGADIVDLKDPARGVLGACDVRVLAEAAAARRRLAPGRPLSAALGAAREDDAAPLAVAAARLGFDYLKAGLDGTTDWHEAVALLRPLAAAARSAAPGARLIAASYADAPAVGALAPADLPAAAAAAGFDGCLLDTAVKDGRGVLDHLGIAGIALFVRACRARGLLAAVAGSIAAPDLALVVAAGPDIIGARGALCAGGRRGRLDGGRVRAFRAAIRAAAHHPPAAG
jgi:uncharacterized protein (UPF0264 family)